MIGLRQTTRGIRVPAPMGVWPPRLCTPQPDGSCTALMGAAPDATSAHLGQWKSPFQTNIEEITRALNSAPCIPSRGWVPIIDKAIAFASEQTPYPFSFFRLAPGNAIAIGRSDMANARAKLDYWRRRLSTEPEQAYCKGYNLNIATRAKVNSQDRWLITQTVMAPYVAASGIAGAKEVIGQATLDLVKDIATAAPLWRKDYKDEMPWYARLDYLIPIAVASVMAGLFFRVKGSAPIVRQPEPEAAPEPEAEPKKMSALPKRQSAPRTSTPTTSLSRTSKTSASTSQSRTSRVSRPPRQSLSGPSTTSLSVPRTSRPSRSSVSTTSAREWAEYKKLLRSGEPRNRRRRDRHSREAA